jgi:hypothetical protein
MRTSADALTTRNPLWTNVADLNSAGAFAALTAWGTRQIEFHIAPTVEEATVPERRRSADVMMQERNRPYLPDAKVITDTDQTHGGESEKRLYNAILRYMNAQHLMFRNSDRGPDGTAERFLKKVQKFFYHLSPYLEELTDVHILKITQVVPEDFHQFFGYVNVSKGCEPARTRSATLLPTDLDLDHDWKRRWCSASKKKKNALSQVILKAIQADAVDLLNSACFTNNAKSLGPLVPKLIQLRDCVTARLQYTMLKAQRMERQHKQTSSSRTMADNFQLVDFITALDAGEAIDFARYGDLSAVDTFSTNFKPVFLNDYMPTKATNPAVVKLPHLRQKWIEDMRIGQDLAMMIWDTGNAGKLYWAWSVPNVVQADTSTKNTVVCNDLMKSDLTVYATRAAQQEITATFEKFGRITGATSTVAMRHTLAKLIWGQNGQVVLAEVRTTPEKIRMERMQELLDNEDSELVHDLKAGNGAVADPALDPFWDEVDLWIKDVCGDTTHERRHDVLGGEGSYLPKAITIRAMISICVDRLCVKHNIVVESTASSSADFDRKKEVLFSEHGVRVPSDKWVAYQFTPTNRSTKESLRYMGRFKPQWKVQRRQVHKGNVDAHWCNAMQRNQREFALLYREHVYFLSMDDKAKVPIGDPGYPIDSGVRAHHAAIGFADAEILAADHDFHLGSVTPSGILFITAPGDIGGSWHQGHLFMGVKCSVLEASGWLRHMTETCKLMEGAAKKNIAPAKDGVVPPLLLAMTDGGPDHNTTFWSVLVGWILLFLKLDLDMLCAMRPAANFSWRNPVERCFSCINLALQHCAFAREKMAAKFEDVFGNCKSMKDIRAAAAEDAVVNAAWLESVAGVKVQLQQRIKGLVWTDHDVEMFDPASNEEIDALWAAAMNLDEQLDPQRTAEASQSDKLQEFVKAHCRRSKYVLQIKKVRDCTCSMCVAGHIKAVRMPEADFDGLDFVPYPMESSELNSDGEMQFRSFGESYRTSTTDTDCPTVKAATRATTKKASSRASDRASGLAHPDKVRAVIQCNDCQKHRCIFSAKAFINYEPSGAAGVGRVLPKTTAAERSDYVFAAIQRVADEADFCCGQELFDEDHEMAKSIVVNSELTCADPMEIMFYSARSSRNSPHHTVCTQLNAQSAVCRKYTVLQLL